MRRACSLSFLFAFDTRPLVICRGRCGRCCVVALLRRCVVASLRRCVVGLLRFFFVLLRCCAVGLLRCCFATFLFGYVVVLLRRYVVGAPLFRIVVVFHCCIAVPSYHKTVTMFCGHL